MSVEERGGYLCKSIQELFNPIQLQSCLGKYIPILVGDFNARLSPNFTQSLPDLFGHAVFAPDLDEDTYPSTRSFLSSNQLAVVSSMRHRSPGLLVTYQEIASDPLPPHSPYMRFLIMSFAIRSRSLFRSIRSHPSVALPWRRRRFLLSASLKLRTHWAPRRPASSDTL